MIKRSRVQISPFLFKIKYKIVWFYLSFNFKKIYIEKILINHTRNFTWQFKLKFLIKLIILRNTTVNIMMMLPNQLSPCALCFTTLPLSFLPCLLASTHQINSSLRFRSKSVGSGQVVGTESDLTCDI
jgi:hypothetical protein